jgi:hypothetical protein
MLAYEIKKTQKQGEWISLFYLILTKYQQTCWLLKGQIVYQIVRALVQINITVKLDLTKINYYQGTNFTVLFTNNIHHEILFM